MCPDIIPLISAIHVHTMCTPWGTHVPWCHLLTLTPSRLFPILLDPKSFQTALNSITWLPGHVLSIRCRLIIIILIYVWLTLAKVCPHSCTITEVMSRDMSSSWCTHSVHIVMEIKEYDIRTHGYGMAALRSKYGGWVIEYEVDTLL